jgi:membrane protease YdiL (CAAX protease family)
MMSIFFPLSATITLLTAAALLYARQRSIPLELVVAHLPAVLLELGLYASLAFPSIREPLSALKPRTLAALLFASALAPWLLYPGHHAPLLLLAITLPVAFWYIVFKPTPTADLALLLLLLSVVLLKGRLFREIYPDPMPGLRLDFLGQLLWIRLAIGVLLLLRRVEGIGFGFLPTRTEWRIGTKYFLQAMPAGLLAASAMGFLQVGTPKAPLWLLPVVAAGVFLGIFAVVACSEEFFLRGLLLGRLLQIVKNQTAALVIVSCISGAVHLGFRQAPNWKFALLSAVVHFFFGRAYLEAGGIRAGMVAHALTATAWILLFAKSG